MKPYLVIYDELHGTPDRGTYYAASREFHDSPQHTFRKGESIVGEADTLEEAEREAASLSAVSEVSCQ